MTSEQAKLTLERIRQARRVVLAIPRELFDMGAWTFVKDCGTTHCIGGWLRIDEWFQRNTPINEYFRLDYGYVYPSEWAITHTDGLSTLLAHVMGIRTGEAKALFGLPINHPDAPETLEDVLRLLGELERKYTPYAVGIIPDDPDWNPAALEDSKSNPPI